jgi:hypothetical protein
MRLSPPFLHAQRPDWSRLRGLPIGSSHPLTPGIPPSPVQSPADGSSLRVFACARPNEPPPLRGQAVAVAGRLAARASQSAGCHAHDIDAGLRRSVRSRGLQEPASGIPLVAKEPHIAEPQEARNGEDTRSEAHDGQILSERQRQSSGEARRCRAALLGRPARRAQAHRVCAVGTQGRLSQRHLPRTAVLSERRASQLRSAASDR